MNQILWVLSGDKNGYISYLPVINPPENELLWSLSLSRVWMVVKEEIIKYMRV